MRPHNIPPDIPDWKLERYLLEELPPEETERIRQEAQTSHALRRRLDDLERSGREIHEQYPPAWMSRQIRRKLSPDAGRETNGRSIFRLLPLPALPALAALLLLAVLPAMWLIHRGPDSIGPDPGIRLKGDGPRLLVFRKTADDPERLEDGSLARQHDLIQLVYHAGGRSYGFIFSTDGRGTLTRHLPASGDSAAHLKTDGPVSLNFAYELDDAPDWERFCFVTSDTPFKVNAITQAARRMIAQREDSLRIDEGLDQFTVRLKKEAIP